MRQQIGLFILLSLLQIGVPEWALAIQRITLDDQFKRQSVGLTLESLLDPEARFRLEDLQATNDSSSWTKSTQETPHFGYPKGAVWLRFEIADLRTKPDKLILELTYAQTDSIELFEILGDKVRQAASGDHTPRQKWDLDVRNPSFVLEPSSEVRTLYLRIQSTSSMQVPLLLSTQEAFQESRYREDLIQALYYGAITAIGTYNFLVWVGTGLGVYGYYVGVLLFYAIFQLSITGYGYAFVWPHLNWFTDVSIIIGLGFLALSSTTFALHLLGFKQKRPGLHPAQIFFMAAFTMCMGLFFTLGQRYAAVASLLVLVMPWAIWNISLGIIAALKRERVAKWYLISWTVFIIGAMIFGFKQMGLVASTPFTIYAHQIGSVIEFILLSFALADRIKDLQERIQKEQEANLVAEKRAREADQRALEEERRLGEQRDQLVANTSHELRTPLNGMMGLAQAIQRRDGTLLSADSQKSLDGIIRSGQRLAALIGDLLDFSRGQRAELPLYRGAISLTEQSELVVNLLQPTLVGRPIRLLMNYPEDLPELYADPDRLQQILFNLLGNAIKFTAEGDIVLSAMADKDFVTIRVEDNGPGIPESAQEKIFEAFTQADGGIARRFGGSGLGLSIVKQLTEAHGGTVGVQSTLGFGSTFWFKIPRAKGEHEIQASSQSQVNLGDKLVTLQAQLTAANIERSKSTQPLTSSKAELPEIHKSPAAGLRILIVDDELINRQVLSELMQIAGHSAHAAADGEEALQLIDQQGAPDLILLDVMMPGISGYEVLRRLRMRFNEAELPILMLSAKALEKDLLQGFALGATDYILKPFSAVEVEARISHQANLKKAIWDSQHAQKESSELRLNLGKLEDQLLHAERLAGIGAATSGIAHDLGSPIQHIKTSLDWIKARAQTVLERGELTSESQSDVAFIHETAGLADKAAGTSLELTKSIRTAVRSDSGAEQIIIADEVIKDVLAILQHKIKRIDLQLQSDKGLAMMGKTSELIQLMMNLISNAADAVQDSPQKKISVKLLRKGDQLLMTVEDNGPGIPDSLRETIFQPFYTSKPSGKGTGLGLAVVKAISKRLRAEIHVQQSKELGGASFEIRIPLLKIAA